MHAAYQYEHVGRELIIPSIPGFSSEHKIENNNKQTNKKAFVFASVLISQLLNGFYNPLWILKCVSYN